MIHNYISRELSIIEHNTKQLSLIKNYAKLIINTINQLNTDYVMVKKNAISAVANTIKQLHIQKNMHILYKQDLNKNKEKGIYDLFLEYLVPVTNNIEHPALIEEWRQNIDASAYEKYLYKDVRLP